MIDKKRKRQLDFDLILIGVVTFLVLGLVLVAFGKEFNGFVYDTSRPVFPRVAVAAICGQFALSGLGITIVCIIRKERFTKYRIHVKRNQKTLSSLPEFDKVYFYSREVFIWIYMILMMWQKTMISIWRKCTEGVGWS